MNPLISAVIAASIVITTSFIVLNAISVITENSMPSQAFNEARHTMGNIRSVINEVLFEATSSRRSIGVDVNGKFIVAGNEDRIKYRVDYFLGPGTRTEDGIQIIAGPVMSAYERDVDNDGTNDLVLENEFVLFAMRKTNSSLNTSDMIILIRNKDTNIDVVPNSAILIDDMVNTSYGNGYTELTQTGYDIPSSSIRLWMNSDANITYEAIFTLGAGSDFVEVEVLL